MANNAGNTGTGILGTLFIIFLVLKICKVINWSWWWITAPLWGYVAIVVVFVLIILLAKVFSRS